MKEAVRKDWDIKGLARDLIRDKRIHLASWDILENMVKMHIPDDEWEEAKEYGFEHEFVEDYLSALSKVVGEALGRDVYWTVEAGEVFLGQVEED